MTQPIRFFVPGPTYVPAELREALEWPIVAHRSDAFRELYRSLGPRLKQVFRTVREVLVSTSSATLAMELGVRSTVRRRVLNLTCGAFSERWHAISLSVGLEADRVSVPWGRAIAPDLVASALRRKRYDAVTVAHNETSTGVINPLADIAAVVRAESEALLLVDAVSSLAGAPVETDAWGLDFVVTASQKALALPPGLALFTASERALERAAEIEHRGFYTDLLRYQEKHAAGGTITTPAVSLFYALDRQLDNVLAEGIEERWRRHRALHEQTRRWAEASGFTYASEDGTHSPTVACLAPPSGQDARELVSALAERGFTVGGGYGDWKETTLRIGHMGEVRSADLDGLFAAIVEARAARPGATVFVAGERL